MTLSIQLVSPASGEIEEDAEGKLLYENFPFN
jgi:hypothetical protein